MATPAVRLRFVEDEGQETGEVVCEVQYRERAARRLSLLACDNDRQATTAIHALNRALDLGRYSAYTRIQDYVANRNGLKEEGRLEAHLSKEITEARKIVGLYEDET